MIEYLASIATGAVVGIILAVLAALLVGLSPIKNFFLGGRYLSTRRANEEIAIRKSCVEVLVMHFDLDTEQGRAAFWDKESTYLEPGWNGQTNGTREILVASAFRRSKKALAPHRVRLWKNYYYFRRKFVLENRVRMCLWLLYDTYRVYCPSHSLICDLCRATGAADCGLCDEQTISEWQFAHMQTGYPESEAKDQLMLSKELMELLMMDNMHPDLGASASFFTGAALRRQKHGQNYSVEAQITVTRQIKEYVTATNELVLMRKGYLLPATK